MERITYRIPLNVAHVGYQRLLQGIYVGEAIARRIVISLTINGTTFEFPTDNSVTASMYITKPGASTPSVNACEIYPETNTIVYDLLPEDIDTAGIVGMQLKLIGTDRNGVTNVIVAPKFQLEIEASDISDGPATTTPTYTALTAALAQAQSVYNKRLVGVSTDEDHNIVFTYADGAEYSSSAVVDAMEDIRQDLEAYMLAAEASAQTATEAADTATEAKDTALNAAEVATTAKEDTVAFAESAEASATSAAESATNAASSESIAVSSASTAVESSTAAAESASTAVSSANTATDAATTAVASKELAVTAANNAVVSASTASAAATAAVADKLASEGYALGTQNGVPVSEGEYFQNNAKYYSDKASGSALAGLSDVAIGNALDGQALVFDSDAKKWKNGKTIPDVVDNLTSSDQTKALSAKMGKALEDGKANAVHNHVKADITDFPTSLPASDVSAWAKAATKPSYTASEVGAAASSHTHTKSQITDFPTSMTPTAHNQAASTITAGTFGGQVVAPAGTEYTTNRIRNGVFTTTDPGANASTSYANGSIIYVYE